VDALQQKQQIYWEMLQRRFRMTVVASTEYEPPTLTPLYRLNEWEETLILIQLYQIQEIGIPPCTPIGVWIKHRLIELRTLYPYVVRSISQGVPVWLRDP
jgi:hypothetical protein